MEINEKIVHSVPPPSEASILGTFPYNDLEDAYIVRLPSEITTDIEKLARHVFEQPEPWIDKLFMVRDTVGATLGFRNQAESGADCIGRFRIYSKSENEIVLGDEDKNLELRVSVLRQDRNISTGSGTFLIVTTVAHGRNLIGRAFLKAATPVHRIIFPSMITKAAEGGWPTADQAAR